MALAIVREKELGSITNLYVTPVTRLEFLVGKQLPYIAVAMVNFALMFAMALVVFRVPLKGSFPPLVVWDAGLRHRDDGLWHADFGVRPHPDRGAVRHRDSDRAAGDAVRRHAGPGFGAVRHRRRSWAVGFPMTYFLPISVGTFTKGLGFADLAGNLAALAVFIPVTDAAQPAAAAQAGALGRRRMRTLANIFWLGTKELRSFLQRFRAARACRLCVLAGDHRAGAKQLAGSAQCVDRHRRRGPFRTVAPDRARLLAALFPDAAADRRA